MKISTESVEAKIQKFQHVEAKAGENIRDRQYARGQVHLLQLALAMCERMEELIDQRCQV